MNNKRTDLNKRLYFISFLIFWFFSAQTHAGETHEKLTLSFSDLPLSEAIKKVEAASSYTFFYDVNKTNLQQPVSLNAADLDIDKAMTNMLKPTDLTFDITNRQIVLIPRREPPSDSPQQNSPQKRIAGTVVDENDEPIIGANVIEKGTVNGTVTDTEGKFSLNVTENAVLQVSFIGYISQEISVLSAGGGISLIIRLMEDTQALDEVVVVGYGTQKKLTLTGAIAAINSEEILTTKSENVENMLSGKIAGVKITQKTSEPGAYTNDFQIRGMGAPLIIVDGVPRDNFNRLDPNEIESISVLKDASASIYGVRAANGVVLVTTKKGTKGAAFRLNYNGYAGMQHMINQPQPLDAIGFMQLQNEKAFNSGSRTPSYPQSSFEPYLNGTKQSTDWQSGAMREDAFQTQHSLSATGGTEKLTYFVNFAYNEQDGFWKSNDLYYKRFNLRSNVTAELAKGLQLDVYVNMTQDTKNQPSSWATWNLFKGFWTQIPLNPYYANDNPDYPFFAADGLHPEYMTDAEKSGYQKRTQRIIQTNMALEWNVPWISGLKAKGMYSYDYKEYDDKNFRKSFNLYTYDDATDTYTAAAVNAPTRLTRRYYGFKNSLLQLSLAYNRTFEADHHVSALLLYEEGDREADNFYAQRDYSMDALDQLFAGNSTNQVGNMNTGSSDLYHYTNKAWVGRLNYDFASRYIAEFSFRYDGSSKFQAGHQWGFFPAGQFGWRMSEEAFVKDSELFRNLSNLKWRVSYGIMGDDNASNYQFLSGYTYPSNGYVFGSDYVNAFGMRGMPNPNITWFEAAVLNLGVDVDLWHGLLGITLDAFQRDRSNLLATRSESLPGLVGANLPQENLESDQTRGFELTLTHRNRIGKDFSYNVSGNMSMARTKWKYKEIARQGNSWLDWRNNQNQRWNDVWWGWENTGRFQSYDEIFSSGIIYNKSRGNSLMLPGDLVFDDWNGDGIIDDNDVHPIGISSSIRKRDDSNNPLYNGGMPLINYGLSIGAEYRRFDLNLVFQGTAMSWLRYPEQLEMPLPWNRNGLDMFLDRWHRTDQFDPDSEWTSGHFPSTFRDNGRSDFITPQSTYWIQDASYLRLKSLELGYTLPAHTSKVAGLQSARIFFSAYNLLTFTGLVYCDPEHTAEDYGYIYPLNQTFNFGVNISF
jgi:TonB-linked SusC/RagA family outer membrane protein